MELPDKVIIKQIVEMLEVFSGFETRNRYSVLDESGRQLFYAYEESGTTERIFLKNMRALKLHVIDENKAEQLSVDKSFAFFFPRFVVKDADGSTLAEIRRRFAFLKNRFEWDYIGQKYTCINKLAHPWTYRIFIDGQQVAQVLKKWGGVGREMFSDADTFLVDLGSVGDKKLRQIILALAFAVDLSVYENKRRN